MLNKTSLESKSKDVTIKKFKFKIFICFTSLIIEHWTPLHWAPHIFLVPLSNWEIFVALEALGGDLQLFLDFNSKGTMCEDSTYFDVLTIRSLAYLP
jgi:hypothetical protein